MNPKTNHKRLRRDCHHPLRRLVASWFGCIGAARLTENSEAPTLEPEQSAKLPEVPETLIEMKKRLCQHGSLNLETVTEHRSASSLYPRAHHSPNSSGLAPLGLIGFMV